MQQPKPQELRLLRAGRCLKVTKASVVTKTVQGLAPAAALQLLSASADRLQSKPTRGQSMYTWLRPLLLHHAAYLMSAPGVFCSQGHCLC